MGELSRELPKAAPEERPGRGKVGPVAGLTSKSTALADLGVSKQRASEWEKIATLPADS